MSAISNVLSDAYQCVYDANAKGGVKIYKDTNSAQDIERQHSQDETIFSDVAKKLAEDVVAMRSAASEQASAEERYLEAQKFGRDFINAVDYNDNYNADICMDRFSNYSGCILSTNASFTVTSGQGTIIGISALRGIDTNRIDEGEYNSSSGNDDIITMQITRKDGFQINMLLPDEDIRINDFENGDLSIYFADQRLTKIYDSNGKETILYDDDFHDNLGTKNDDIIINQKSSVVDGGDGDDIIIDLHQGTKIFGGAGNDKIIIPMNGSEHNIDTGEGDDIIAAISISQSNISMGSGDNSIYTSGIGASEIVSEGDISINASLSNTSIQSNSDITIKGRNLHNNITLQANNIKVNVQETDYANIISSGTGTHELHVEGHIYSVDRSKIALDGAVNIIEIAKASRSDIVGGSGRNIIVIKGAAWRSNISGGSGDDLIHIGELSSSNVYGGDGNDIIIVTAAHAYSSSSIKGGGGNDTILTRFGGWDISGGEGDDTILASGFKNDSGIHRWYWEDEDWIENFVEEGDISTAYERYAKAAQQVLANAEYMDAKTKLIYEYYANQYSYSKSVQDWSIQNNLQDKAPEEWGQEQWQAFRDEMDRRRKEFVNVSLQSQMVQSMGLVGSMFLEDLQANS